MTMQIPIEILDVLETPMIFFHNDGNFMYATRAARSILPGRPEDWKWPHVTESLPKDYIHQLHQFSMDGWQGTVIECTSFEQSVLQGEIYKLKRRNEELEKIVDASADELFVTDGEGQILMVSGHVEELYNIKKEDLVGRTVFDLERESIFYPSVISLVLRNKQRHTILQTTQHGRQLAVTGKPVFDEEGRITRVISYAIDIRELPWILNNTNTRGNGDGTGDNSLQKPLSLATPVVAYSTSMRSLIAYSKRAASSDATILILGETGVGKNRLARTIHEQSRRFEGPLVEVNCAALPESLMESELFGYERGAFTGSNREGKIGKVEMANRGTLFLNEVGELPLHLQAKLLDFIQDHQFSRIGGVRTITVDVRIIAATNRNLEEMVKERLFRSDLYYRLNVLPILVPALRDRKEDIEALCVTVLSNKAQRNGLSAKHLHPDTLTLLQQYNWPGNVRELENLLERLCISIDENLILPKHLPDNIRLSRTLPKELPYSNPEVDSISVNLTGQSPLRLRDEIERFEAKLLADALTRWKTTYAISRALDISQPTVVRKLKRYGLT
jgi:PAS domain S-box-containing protein